jgi:transposase
MKRFIQGENRKQSTLFPEVLDDYISDENQIRVIDVFVDSLDLHALEFERVVPKKTGRPSYHPSVMLKLYIYGYLNRIQSSRRLEKETQRNVELMWLMGRLTPDYKTIADFRKDNDKGIINVCRKFIDLCRQLKLFTDAVVAIDGSRFKAVNKKNRNYTKAKIKSRIERAEATIAAYLSAIDKADREAPEDTETKQQLNEKIKSLKQKIAALNALEKERQQVPDGQISLTDPDSRAMSTKANISGLVGYNIQSAVDTKNHIIVAHKTTNIGSDRGQLSSMAELARSAIGEDTLVAIADKGYYSGREILAVKEAGMEPLVPKILTSGNKKKGLFTKADFHYLAEDNEYQCPAGERLIYRYTSLEKEMNLHTYWSSNCQACSIKEKCTKGKLRRVKRWEHEQVLDDMEAALKTRPDAMLVRKSTVEHPFGTIKSWMGATHFQMRRLKNVNTEMSLHILAYNLKRVMSILGEKSLMEAIKA